MYTAAVQACEATCEHEVSAAPRHTTVFTTVYIFTSGISQHCSEVQDHLFAQNAKKKEDLILRSKGT